MFPQPAHHITSHSNTSRKCSTSSHREPCVMTSLKDHDSDCDLYNHEIYVRHQQPQCAQPCYLPSCDIQLPYIHTRDHQVSLHAPTEDNMYTRETTDISKLAGIHKPYSSQLYGQTNSDDYKCAVSDCNRSSVENYNRPTMENVPMVECSVLSNTLLRKNSGKVKRPTPCETPGYFILQHQS